jgi:membrane protein
VARGAKDVVQGLAAELAFRFMFATFPFVVFAASLSGFVTTWVGVADPVGRVIDALGRSLPADLIEPLRRQLNAVLLHHEPELLSLGALLALYGAAGGMGTLMKAMNRALNLRETRPLQARIFISLALTVFGGVAAVFSTVAVVGGMLATQQVVDGAGLRGIWPAISLLRWPIAFGLLVIAGAAMLRFAPCARPAWRWALGSAAASAAGWLVVTYVFALYVARFGSFSATYGALAGVIVFMLWYYLSALVLLLAVEMVAALSQRHPAE